jgi:hypothetical protein
MPVARSELSSILKAMQERSFNTNAPRQSLAPLGIIFDP